MTDREILEYKTKYVHRIAENMNEEVATVLAYLSEATQTNGEGGTANEVMQATAMEKNRARLALLLLDVTNFVKKTRVDHSWVYSPTEDGEIALKHLLDGRLYPGRAIKIKAVLGMPSEPFVQ